MWSAWAQFEGDSMVGQITNMAESLKVWSADIYRKFGKQIEKVEKDLQWTQQQPISETMCNTQTDLEKKLDDLYAKHEAYWHLRSRVAEVRDGDKNTKYFHHKASQRKKMDFVTGLFDDHGNWFEDV